MSRICSKILLSLLISCTVIVSAVAENMKTLGSMDVHYIAIGATFLTPEITKAYDIERSRYNGLINISVLNNTQPNKPAMAVDITGTAQNNIGQIKQLQFKQVTEGNAIYYLAQLHYSDQEDFHFNITIKNGKTTQHLKFSQKFYVE